MQKVTFKYGTPGVIISFHMPDHLFGTASYFNSDKQILVFNLLSVCESAVV